MAKIITVTIDENGDAEIDLAGYNGKGCDAVMKGFNKALGARLQATLPRPSTTNRSRKMCA